MKLVYSKINKRNIIINILNNNYWGLGIGDWGLGIGAQSPIPNPQSPIPNPQSPIPMIDYYNFRKNFKLYK
jgi:hypothetical protein